MLWLWCRLAAIALTKTLVWELPYAAGVALKRQRKKKGKFLVYLHGRPFEEHFHQEITIRIKMLTFNITGILPFFDMQKIIHKKANNDVRKQMGS